MLECYIKKPNLIFSLIGAGFFVFLGILVVTGTIGVTEASTEIDRIFGIGLGWACILFFGGIAVIALKQNRQSNRGPVVRIDETGFLDRRIGSQPIPWTAIRAARISSGETLYAAHTRYISLDVAEPEAYITQGFVHLFPRLNRVLKKLYDEPGISISTSLLDQSPETILAAIERESKGLVPVDN